MVQAGIKNELKQAKIVGGPGFKSRQVNKKSFKAQKFFITDVRTLIKRETISNSFVLLLDSYEVRGSNAFTITFVTRRIGVAE